MSVHPNPYTMARFAEQRCAEFQAEAEQARRVKLAQATARRQPWVDHPALRSVAVLLTLLQAAAQRG